MEHFQFQFTKKPCSSHKIQFGYCIGSNACCCKLYFVPFCIKDDHFTLASITYAKKIRWVLLV